MTPTDTYVDRSEGLVQGLAERVAAKLRLLDDRMGERPYGTAKPSPEEQALFDLPDYVIEGHAADYDEQGAPLARAYWQRYFDAGGPREVLRHMKQMRKLYQQYSPDWVLAMSPEQYQRLDDLQARGLHSGGLRPPLQAEDESEVA